MNNFINLISFNIKQKKGLFIFLLILTLAAIVLAIIAGINFSDGIFSVDLSNISYIEFLKGETGWFGLFFGLILSLLDSFPSGGETLIHENIELVVQKVKNKKIEKVKLTILEIEESNDDSSEDDE